MNVAYVRVSAAEQNEARQKEALEKYEIEKWFIEKVSAKDTNREEFPKLMDFVREGEYHDYIRDFSRLVRSTMDLLSITARLGRKRMSIWFLTRRTLMLSTANGKLMLTMIAAIAEFGRANMLERQREGCHCQA